MTEAPSDSDRKAWDDHHARQAFEHALIDRKTVWSLTAHGLLFAGYGVAAGSGDAGSAAVVNLLRVLPVLGIVVSLLTFLGVAAVVNSKRISWRDYREHFGYERPPFVPSGAARSRGARPVPWLQWGVRTTNTMFTLAPDLLYPLVFTSAWLYLAVVAG